jgi:hypothetical protein
MSKLVSLFILSHIIAVGWYLSNSPRLVRPRLFFGVWIYFGLAFAAMAYGLRLVPNWLDPRL